MDKRKKQWVVITCILFLFMLAVGAIVYHCFSDSMKTKNEPTYKITIEECENGTVKSNKLIYKEGDKVTLTITPKGAYVLDTLWVDGSDKTASVVNGQLQLKIMSDMTISATFHEVMTRDTLVTIPGTCNMRGMQLTLSESGKKVLEVTVSDDNTFNLFSVRYGTNYRVTGTVCGMQVFLGNLVVKSENEEFDPSWLFDVSYGGTIDLAAGNFSYENTSSTKLTVTATENSMKSGDAWVAAKINLSPEDVATLTGMEGKEATFGIGMMVGDKTEYVDIWLKTWEVTSPPEVVYGLKTKSKQQNNVFIGAGLLTDYGKALAGDGLYYVVHYDAENGKLESYLGESVDNVTLLRDWGTEGQKGAAYFEKNSTLYAFTIGSNRKWGSTPVTVNFSNVKYGATLGEALGLDEMTGSINAEFVSIKHGALDTKVPDGTKVTLTREHFKTVHTTVKNGRLIVNSLPFGTWTVSVDGYEDTTITLEHNQKYRTKIEIEHIFFVDYLKNAGWKDYVDLTRQNDGIITQESGTSMFVATNDTYDSVAVSLNLSTEGLTAGRHGTFVKFDNEYVFIGLEPKNGGESYKISWNGFGTISNWPPAYKEQVNLKPEYWKEQVPVLSEEQISALNDGSLYFTLVREENTIYAFVDGEYCNKVVLDEKYATMKCQVGIYGTKMKKNMVRNFKIEDGNFYLAKHPTIGSVNAKVTGHKYNVAGNNLADGVSIKLTLKAYGEERTAVIENGRLAVSDLEAGVWTLEAEGYVPLEITIKAGETLTDDIILEYAMFTDYLKAAKWSDYADLSKQNYGVIAQKSGATMFVGTNDTYDSVAISLNLSTEGLTAGRHGTFVKFDNEYVFIGLEPKNGGESYKISWNGFGTISNWPPAYKEQVNLKAEYWKEQVPVLSAEQISALNDGSLYFTLVREENTIYAFVDGEYCDKVVLDEKYAEQKCQVGIYGQKMTVGMIRNFQIESGESYFAKHPTIGSVNAKVTGHKYNVAGNNLADGVSIKLTLKAYGEERTAVIENGRLAVSDLEAGVWTLEAEGYVPLEITIKAGETLTDDIILEYAMFTDYLKAAKWSDYADLSKQNYGVIAQESGATMFVGTNDTYDSVAISLNLSTEGLTAGRHGTFVKFDNEYVFIGLEPKNGGESYKISWNGFGTISNWPPAYKEQVNLKAEYWKEQVPVLSAEQVSALNDGSLYFTLVREANTIYAFVDGEYCNKVVLDEKYAEQKCQVGIYGQKMTVGMIRNFQIESGESYFAEHPTTGTVNAKITGHKYNVAGNNLADGVSIKLTLKAYSEERTAVIENGRLAVSDLEAGVWTLEAEGYVPLEITIKAGETLTEDIVLEYELFTDYLKDAGWTDYADLSKQNYGVIVQESGATMFVGTNDTYDSVAISLNLSTEGLTAGRHGTFVKFDNEYVFIGLEPKNGGESYKISWNGFGTISNWPPAYKEQVNLKAEYWKEQVPVLSAEQVSALNDGSLYFTLVREANTIYAFVNGEYCNKVVLDEKYAEQKCQVGIYGQKMTVGMIRNFKIEDGSVYRNVTVTLDEQLEHGNLTTNADSIKVSDKLTITFRPDEGYIPVSLSVNGKQVETFTLVDKQDGTYSFTFECKTAQVNLNAEFVEANKVRGVIAATAGASERWALPTGTSITIKGNIGNEIKTTVGENGIYQAMLPNGTYAVSAEGYDTQTLTIVEDTQSADITLAFDLLADTDYYTISSDESSAIVQKKWKTVNFNQLHDKFVLYYTLKPIEGQSATNGDNMGLYILNGNYRYSPQYYYNGSIFYIYLTSNETGTDVKLTTDKKQYATVNEFNSKGHRFALVRNGNKFKSYIQKSNGEYVKVAEFSTDDYKGVQLMNWSTTLMYYDIAYVPVLPNL